MGAVKIRNFISELISKGNKHPLYQEAFDAFVSQKQQSVDEEIQEETEKAFFLSYKNLLGHLKKRLILSEVNIIPEELESLIAQLKPAVLSKQAQLLMLQSLLNYAKKHHGIDSPNIPSIVTLRRDKPILTPVDLVKLPIVDMLYTLLDNELITPNRTLSLHAKLGRSALLVYVTTSLNKTRDLLSILESPKDIFYVGGICYWQSQKNKATSTRFVLSDVAVMALQQWSCSQEGKPLKVTACIKEYLNTVSDFNWSDLSIIKLRTLRKIDNALRYGSVQYQMYFLPSISQALPEHAFMRLLTNKACLNSEPHIYESSVEGANAFKPWKKVIGGHATFIDIDITSKQLDKIFVRLLLLYEKKEPRANHLAFMNDTLNAVYVIANPYLWLLCSWLYSLLKNGGTFKRRLKVTTTVDYVKSLSKPFLTLFSTCDIGLLSGEDWANKLNEAAELFTSAQRKKYVYYFAQFLIDTNLVRDLCLSDIDVIGSSSEVDANLISPTHIDEVLNYLIQHVEDDPIYQYAYFLLCFCFFSGLRRNETAKLTWADFSFAVNAPSKDEFDYVQLSVRPNQYRTLKTTAARRELPLDALWPKSAINKLRKRYQIHQNTGASKKALLFDNAKQVNQAYELITDLIRHYTQDYTLRVHHLRHSFANWTWCRLNPNLIKKGRTQLTIFKHEIFDNDYLQQLQTRLRYRANTRKKMFILSHLMGHKEVHSTLNSYLHLKDILFYLELTSRFTLTKYFASECVGRATLLEQEQGLSLAERIHYYAKGSEETLAIKPAPLTSSLSIPTLSTFVRNIKPNIDIHSLTWAKALNALKVSSVIESSQYFNVPMEQLQQLFNNAEHVHQHYPRVGKHLPLIPAFPMLSHSHNETESDVNLAKSSKVFIFLCNKFDKSIGVERLTLANVRLSMEILNYAVPGKDYALRCPNSKVSRMFIRFCQLLGLKDRHLKFKFHRADLTIEQSHRIENRWRKTITDYGFIANNFVIASESEGRYLGNHDGSGFLEIALVNNGYKRVQRHQSLFSFLHFLLILSYQEEE
ncbi:tyrosine-type recombinase/integrase [Shewanella frigidimarina]|uniref:tyrosine-type recombinase/integrase n=1 Tax=Shewanella frigidimarina TaxID=56812 RepID=UPI0031737C60